MSIDNQISIKGITVWLVCALFFMYEFLLRTVLGTFQHPLMSDLALSPVTFAILSSTAYQIIYGLMQIPVGIITDRFGLKRTLFCAVLFCALANVGFAFTHEFTTAVIFRLLMGFGASFGFVCLLVAVYDWMPHKNIALFIGISQFIGTMGPMLAAGPFNTLAQNEVINWRLLFLGLAIFGGFLALLVLFFVDKNRRTQGKFIILSRPTHITTNLSRILKQKQTWYIAIFSASVYFAIEYLSENEGISFLLKKGFSSGFSSYMITVAWLGYALSCPLLGFISDKIQRRKPVLLISAVIAFIALTGIIYLPLGKGLTLVCFALLGFGAAGQSVGFAVMSEQCKGDYLAAGLGFNNAMIMMFAAANAPLIGMLLSNLSKVYPTGLASYQNAFLIMLGLVMLAIIMSIFGIQETFCKSMRENTSLTP